MEIFFVKDGYCKMRSIQYIYSDGSFNFVNEDHFLLKYTTFYDIYSKRYPYKLEINIIDDLIEKIIDLNENTRYLIIFYEYKKYLLNGGISFLPPPYMLL